MNTTVLPTGKSVFRNGRLIVPVCRCDGLWRAQTGAEIDRQIDRQTDRQTDIFVYREVGMCECVFECQLMSSSKANSSLARECQRERESKECN